MVLSRAFVFIEQALGTRLTVILIGYLNCNTISPLFADYKNRSFPEPLVFVEHAP